MLTVDLSSVTTALDADADVHVGKAVLTQQQNRLEDLVAQDLRFNQLDGAAIDLDQTAALLAVRDGHGRLLAAKGLDRLRRGEGTHKAHATAGGGGQGREAQVTALAAALPYLHSEKSRRKARGAHLKIGPPPPPLGTPGDPI